uniref:DoxX family membrane protein n=1 Tax=Eiseniibacteriota bacterium TaxID=2212470 RepID=A0A832I2D3_UNCEI
MGAALAFLRRPEVVRLARIAIGLVFIAAALGKIGDLPAFVVQLHNYRMVPVWSEHLLAITMPWIELVAGLALVLGVRARAGAVIVLALMAVFTVAVGSAWARGLDFECGCFGKASASTIGARKFFENVGFTLLAAVAALRPAR